MRKSYDGFRTREESTAGSRGKVSNREMEMKVAEDKSWPKKEYLRTSRVRSQKAVVSNILDAIAQAKGGEVVCESDEDGAVRMKILVKKGDLKQVLEAMRDDDKSNARQSSSASAKPSPMSLEQRLTLMRKRQIMKTTQLRIRSQRSSWRPALQSIPEEL